MKLACVAAGLLGLATCARMNPLLSPPHYHYELRDDARAAEQRSVALEQELLALTAGAAPIEAVPPASVPPAAVPPHPAAVVPTHPAAVPPHPECRRVCELIEQICDLSERICFIASRHRDDRNSPIAVVRESSAAAARATGSLPVAPASRPGNPPAKIM